MSSPNGDDWDLCWYFLSGSGCRNPSCTWRHDLTPGRLYQNHKREYRGIGRYHRGERRKTRGAPFFPIKHHHDGGVEDQYGLVHYPDIDKYGTKKRIQLSCRSANRVESEQAEPDSIPMNVSSSGKTSGPTSSDGSMITSRDESDSEGDVSWSSTVSSSRVGKVRRRNSRLFSPAVFRDLERPRRQLKMKWYPNKPITSVLSPFAKIFVPRVNLSTSADASSTSDREIMNNNRQLDTIKQPENLKSDGDVIDETDE